MAERLVLGIDEAGRGPVLGPLVLAGALLPEERLPELAALGVADSKTLSPSRREELDARLRAILADFRLLEYAPAEIDRAREKHELDILEARGAARLVRDLRPHVAYVDAPGLGGKLFRERIEAELQGRRPELVVENKADANYAIVSAASILAKVARDRHIAHLASRHGKIGSGYPGDPATRDWLAALVASGRPFPDFVRKSWATVRRSPGEQGLLFDES